MLLINYPLLSTDQADTDHFCPVRVGDLASPVTDSIHSLSQQLEETEHLKQNYKTNTIQSLRLKKSQMSSSLWPTSICKFLPTQKNLQHISARSVLLLNNRRRRNLLQPYVEIALCLNWVDECIVTATVFVCLFLFFYLLCYWAIKCVSKGKAK